MPSFTDLEQENPTIREQYDSWRQARSENGQDASDYQAFRAHLGGIGAPDPGETEPDDFVGDDFKAANPDRYPNFQAQSA